MPLDSASNDITPKIPPNKVYKSDLGRAVQYSRWFLQFLGVWAMVSRHTLPREKYVSKCLLVFCFSVMAYMLIPALLDTLLRVKEPFIRIMRMGPLGTCTSSMIKYIYIILRRKTIKLCIEHMEYDWMKVEKENERAIMTRNATVGRGVTVVACGFMYTAGIFFNTFMPLLRGSTINERNETIRPLGYPRIELWVDPQKSPNYEIIYCTTCCAAFLRYTVAITACNLAAVFVTHACGQMQIVILRLESLFHDMDEKLNKETIQERISSIIQCHVRALRLSTRIDEVLREICLVEVIAATCIICLLEYYCLAEWNRNSTVGVITYIIFLTSYIFNAFIFCYIGELLTEQCAEVGRSSYMIEWYKLPGKTGLSIVMILIIASIPRKVTAGGMLELSIASFGLIMKTSVMYLNMIIAMAD